MLTQSLWVSVFRSFKMPFERFALTMISRHALRHVHGKVEVIEDGVNEVLLGAPELCTMYFRTNRTDLLCEPSKRTLRRIQKEFADKGFIVKEIYIKKGPQFVRMDRNKFQG